MMSQNVEQADVCDVIRSSALDCFWLCDGSLKVYDVPHLWQNPRQIYFGSAAVNMGNGRQIARSLMNQNQLRLSTGVSLGYSMNTDSGPSEDDSDSNPWAELS